MAGAPIAAASVSAAQAVNIVRMIFGMALSLDDA
jgi:hypothetical protein